MYKNITFFSVGFTVAVVAGFIIGKNARSATPGNVQARMNGGTVVIEADLKNIARQSLSDSKADIVDKIRSYF